MLYQTSYWRCNVKMRLLVPSLLIWQERRNKNKVTAIRKIGCQMSHSKQINSFHKSKKSTLLDAILSERQKACDNHTIIARRYYKAIWCGECSSERTADRNPLLSYIDLLSKAAITKGSWKVSFVRSYSVILQFCWWLIISVYEM